MALPVPIIPRDRVGEMDPSASDTVDQPNQDVHNVLGELQAASEVSEPSDHQSIPGDVQADADVHSEDASSSLEIHDSGDTGDTSDSSSSTTNSVGQDISQVAEDESDERHTEPDTEAEMPESDEQEQEEQEQNSRPRKSRRPPDRYGNPICYHQRSF